MQNGSLTKETRKYGADVWTFRWRERDGNGKIVLRRITVGTTQQFPDRRAASKAVAGIVREINFHDSRIRTTSMTVTELVDHYRQRELSDDNARITHSTKRAYEDNLRRWILPRWAKYSLSAVKAMEVELWLANIGRARSTCAKLRNLMSLLFNHARRHDLFDRNPISLVRQSAKRRTTPEVLTAAEIQQILQALTSVEHVAMLLDVSTGLRQSELFALKWTDVDFETKQVSVTRSIVHQVVGPCKTEASQKPVPLHDHVVKVLQEWKCQTRYSAADDWVFASPFKDGQQPYWGPHIMRSKILPATRRLGITKRIGWHTFRHSYSTLLRVGGADIKVMQELLRHASARVTLDTYTQAVTPAKRTAQSSVMSLLFPDIKDQTPPPINQRAEATNLSS